MEADAARRRGTSTVYSASRSLAPRSERPTPITHVDGSARVQTVSRRDNWQFWRLLTEFERFSGLPILVNTSFNVRGQPIVCTPPEAIDTFIAAGLDGLAIGDWLVTRKAMRVNK